MPKRPKRLVSIEIFHDPNDHHHPVKCQPRMACLNSESGDTVQWYGAGDEFTVDLGQEDHPFDYNGRFVKVPKGECSVELKFKKPGAPTGKPGLPKYELLRGKHSQATHRAALTGHGGVIFDP